jgi:diaminohydroxyphosphoribosylaminopyrimidine deaminase/5-amino-6-(5-phosphoribosylamino)uracil reductase
MSSVDEHFMRIALELARQGRGGVEPNPMVGAVLVRSGVEIARGLHRRFGAPHAEAQCLDAARAAGIDPRGSTMYVTLEPCCGFAGKKTPPCAEAIVEAGIARVVVAMEDVDRNVAGRGIESLRRAGIEVETGVCQAEAKELLAPYVKLRTQGRPWVICKWAQTRDGLLALPPAAADPPPEGQRRWISGEQSRTFVHQLRGLCEAICVGIGTVLADDPLLTNRSGAGKQPARVVLDSRLRIPPRCRLVRTARESPVIVVAGADAAAARQQAVKKLTDRGVEVLAVPSDGAKVDLGALLDDLGRRQWTYLLVEGGRKVLESFVLTGLADELFAFVSPRAIADAPGDLPRFDIAQVAQRLSLVQIERRDFGRDVMVRYRIRR